MMSLRSVFVLSIVLVIVHSSAVISSTSIHTDKKCTQEAIFNSGCAANVCFAFDGSGSVTRKDFKRTINFVMSVTNALGLFPETEYCANQFGRIAYLISFLTKDRLAFNVKLQKQRFIGDKATSVGSGIVMCDALLSSRKGEPNKIVLLTDGRNNFGGNPIGNAQLFRDRDPNGRISAVGVGNVNKAVLRAIAGDSGHVLTVSNYIQLSQIVNNLVCQVCDIV